MGKMYRYLTSECGHTDEIVFIGLVMNAVATGRHTIEDITRRLSFGESDKPADVRDETYMPDCSDIQRALNLLESHELIEHSPSGLYIATSRGQKLCEI